jgi:homoserine kinase
MSASRRSILAAGAGLASLGGAGATGVALARSATDQAIHELIQRSAQSNAALMRGDINTYRALISLTDDFTLMAPFGGTPTHART